MLIEVRQACELSVSLAHATSLDGQNEETEEKEMSAAEWKDGFRLKVEDFVSRFVEEGAKPEEVLDAIVEEVTILRAVYERDPNPADDETTAIEDPANDWPSAD